MDILAIWPEKFVNLFGSRSIRQRQHTPKRTGEGWALERSHQFEHRLACSTLTIVADLDTGKDDACRNSDRVDEIGERRNNAIYLVSLTWESVAILLFRRELTLDLVDDFLQRPDSLVVAKASCLCRGMAPRDETRNRLGMVSLARRANAGT